jgi:hypothetical protein
VHELCYAPRGAFSLAATTARFARLGDSVSVVEDGSFARLVPAGSGHALVRVAQEGPASRARLRLSIEGATDEPAGEARRAWSGVLGRRDLRPFQRTARDPLLPACCARTAGSWRAARAVRGLVNRPTHQGEPALRVLDPRQLVPPGRRALMAAPGPRSRPQTDPRACRAIPAQLDCRPRGASRALARAAPRARSTGRLAPLSGGRRAEPVRWKGISRWTAAMCWIRSLGRLDIFPAGDLAG